MNQNQLVFTYFKELFSINKKNNESVQKIIENQNKNFEQLINKVNTLETTINKMKEQTNEIYNLLSLSKSSDSIKDLISKINHNIQILNDKESDSTNSNDSDAENTEYNMTQDNSDETRYNTNVNLAFSNPNYELNNQESNLFNDLNIDLIDLNYKT